MADEYGFVSVYEWTPVLTAGAVDVNDVLVAGETLPKFYRYGKQCMLTSLDAIVTDDAAVKLEIVLFSDLDASLGTIDSGVTITDAHAISRIGKVIVETADYTDWINSQDAERDNLNIGLSPSDSTTTTTDTTTFTSIRAGIIDRTGTTPTWTASGLTIKFHLLHT